MKKQFVILVLAVFFLAMLPLTSAFLNIKTEYTKDTPFTLDKKVIEYNPIWEKYAPIKIESWLGLGNIVFSGAIIEHTNTCGNDITCLSTMEIYIANDGVLIDDIIFKTLQKDNSWVEQNIRSYQFKYLGTIDDYETVCTLGKEIISENETYIPQICEQVLIGNHEGWINYQIGNEILAGEYTLKLTGNKKPSRTVDWIIETNGKWLNEWATWGNISLGDDAEVILNSPADASTVYSNPVTFNASIDVTGGAYLINMSLWTNETGSWEQYNLTLSGINVWEWDNVTSYYKLDNTTGVVYDMVRNNDGTNNGADRGVTGKIGNAFEFIAANNDYIDLNVEIIKETEEYTVNLWVKPNLADDSNNNYFISQSADSAGRQRVGIQQLGTTYRGITVNSDDTQVYAVTTSNVDTSKYQMITLIRNSTNLCIYFNGTLQDCGVWDGTEIPNSNEMWFGSRANPSSAKYWDGKMDEPVIFNRALSDLEILELYNLGAGNRGEATSNLIQIWERTITDVTLWNVQACDSDGDCGFAPSNFTVNLDITPPNISLSYPTGTIEYTKVGNTLDLNWTISELGVLDTCWYNYNNTNTTVTCGDNTTTFTITNQKNLTFYANDSFSNLGSETTTWDYKVLETSRTLNTSSYETQSETFSINITANASLTAVTLDYNGTSKSTTKSGTVYSTTFDIPSTNLGNNSVRWKFTYAGDTINSDYSYQNISLINFSLCDGSLTDDFLNISFKDEADLEFINASIPVSRFIYYLGGGTETKLFTYVNNTDNYNYEFCATPDLTFNVDSYVQYKQGTDYPQRIYDPDVVTYNSTVTNIILYLLNSLDGIYSTFQVINSAEQAISGVGVTGTRVISGEDVEVASGLTDASGSVTFWVNPDFQHIFNFIKTGYEDTTFIVTPTQPTYTITLGGGTVSETDCTRGVGYSITPTNNFLDQNTEYDFTYTIDSSYWVLTGFAASLYYGNDTLIDSDSSTTQEGGTLTFNSINTTNQTQMYLQYSYEINDSTCLSTSTNWIVQSIDGRAYSLWNLLEQTDTYMEANLYGVKGDAGNSDFGRIVIVFLIVVLVAGVSIRQYGIQSETAIMSIVLSIVAILDVGLNFIPVIQMGDIGIGRGLLTSIVFLIWLIFLIKER